MKILFIEEDIDLRELLCDFVQSQFPTVELFTATDDQEARSCIESQIPELVFIDVNLPESIQKPLRVITITHPDIVVVAMTKEDTPRYRKAALQAGAHYLTNKNGVFMQEVSTLIEGFLNTDHSA